MSQALIGPQSLDLVNAVAVDAPLVAADENRLQQILYNLIGNAIKFSETGKVTVSTVIITGTEIPLAAQTTQTQLLALSVNDTGIGIPADKLSRIFESFEQVEGSLQRVYGGTGLGLATTKQLVELHGGQIWVESTEGQGSTFTFTVPLSAMETMQLEIICPAVSEKNGQGQVQASNAGCVPPIIKRNEGLVEWIEIGGMPLGTGLGHQLGYQEITLPVSQGDLIILTSDGVIEATNAASEMFSFERLEQAVTAGPATSATAMLAYLKAEVEAFIADGEPHDDLTIVVVRV